MERFGQLVVDTLPKACGRLAHKSVLYAALVTKVTDLLAKNILEECMAVEIPRALKEGDRMALTASLRFLGMCVLNGSLEDKMFYKIMKKLSTFKSNLVAFAFLYSVPLFQSMSKQKNPLIETYMNRIGEYIESQVKKVPDHFRPFRKFDKDKDTLIPNTPKEDKKADEPMDDAEKKEDSESKDVEMKTDSDKKEDSQKKEYSEKKEDTDKKEDPPKDDSMTSEVPAASTESLITEAIMAGGDQPPRERFEELQEDEYEDFADDYDEEAVFELEELWKCYKSRDIHPLARTKYILHSEVMEDFTMNDYIVKDYEIDDSRYVEPKDVPNQYKSRVLKRYVIDRYNGDELDYFFTYDMICNILTRYDRVCYNALKQIEHLEEEGDYRERVIYDVFLSELFQLPRPNSELLYYITFACKMWKRCPVQALNLMIKKMPRMDPEVRERFIALYTRLLNHKGFNISDTVLKKITDKESQHYKHVGEIINELISISYPQKLGYFCESVGLPKDLVSEEFGNPTFIHGEDEDDIKNLVEKLRFKEDGIQEFEDFYNGEEMSCLPEDKEEFLFEAIFRKANRNYSFMHKVIETYSDKLQDWFTDKEKIVERLFNMFEKTPVRLKNFLELFLKKDFALLKPEHVYAYLSKVEQAKEGHFKMLQQVFKNLRF